MRIAIKEIFPDFTTFALNLCNAQDRFHKSWVLVSEKKLVFEVKIGRFCEEQQRCYGCSRELSSRC